VSTSHRDTAGASVSPRRAIETLAFSCHLRRQAWSPKSRWTFPIFAERPHFSCTLSVCSDSLATPRHGRFAQDAVLPSSRSSSTLYVQAWCSRDGAFMWYCVLRGASNRGGWRMAAMATIAQTLNPPLPLWAMRSPHRASQQARWLVSRPYHCPWPKPTAARKRQSCCRPSHFLEIDNDQPRLVACLPPT
jgi:hypothetical protein